MAHLRGPARSALFLVVIVAAGLRFYSASSTSASTPPNTDSTSGRTTSADQTAQQNDSTSASTISVTASLPSRPPGVTSSQITDTVSSATTPVLKILTVATTSSSPQPSTELQRTEHTVAPTTSVASQIANTVPHSEVLATTSPYITSASSTSALSTFTNLSTVAVTRSPNTEMSTVTVIISKKPPPEETTSVETPTASTFLGPTEGHTLPLVTSASKITPETSHTDGATFSSGVTVQEAQHALSSGSIAAITITVIAVVLLVFGIAAFLKIRHSSYGRLLDDHDYGSWGNYNNPLYDDS
ncbi:prostate androgen-regulated mucin-like protein 1 [Tiliqua scincoides]|uniref:prostate androgen-regulated mucin-like protein 1 n=1 Tax=Tiliqua scincoides TaxID=71010 RepID=UPI003461E52A